MVSASRREISLFIAASIVLVVAGFLSSNGLIVRLLAVFSILFFGQKIGESLINTESVIKQWLAGSLSLIALTVLFQTGYYYLDFNLGGFTDATSLALSIAMLSVFSIFNKKNIQQEEVPAVTDKQRIMWITVLSVPAIIAFGFIVKALFANGTIESIRTPWPFLPEGSFVAFAILPVIAWLMAKKTSSVLFTGMITVLSTLGVTLIAPLIYTLGYGFDGFLHRASQKILLETGTLTPKPLYYIGQYTLNTWMSRLMEIDIMHLDRFLVPLSVAIIIIALFLTLKPTRTSALSVSASSSLLLLSPFVATTPQAFAYIIGISALILAFGTREKNIHPLLPMLLAIWCMAIHPLAGLPFIGAVATTLWTIRLSEKGMSLIKSPLLYLLIFATSISVPLAFVIFSGGSGQILWDFSRLWQALPSMKNIPDILPRNHIALWADWANYAAFLLPICLWGLSAFTLQRSEKGRIFVPLLLIAAGTWCAGLALSTVGEFTFLINYERGNYSERLTLISYLLLFYPALLGFGYLSKSLLKRGPVAITLFLLCFGAWYAGHAYNALPRHDAAAASRGWSVGIYDFEAVRFIEQHAGGEPYTVLANQSVSAASVETLGFARYVKNEKTGEDIFYYPIPTGGTLYQLYLEAVSPEPSLDAILEAGSLAKADRIYVVLNEYWWDAKRVGETLETLAEDTFSFGDGQVRVFRFSSQK